MYGRVLFALILVACAPSAAAFDPFQDQLCIDEDSCYGAGTCAEVACVPRGCAPVACRGAIPLEESECVVNATIDGRTCASYVGVEIGTGDGTGVWLAAESSNGSVYDFNLPNTWASPGAEAHVNTMGFDLGYYYAYLYTSDITTEGPRGGPVALVAQSQNHTWKEIGVAAGGGGHDTVVAVEFLDFMPEGCWARSPGGALPEVECPSFSQLYP